MSDELVCGFCSQNIEALALSQREDHYEAHFLAFGNESVTSAAESSRQNAIGKDKLNHKPWKNLGKKLENDVFWYPSLGIPPPRNYTPGDMPVPFSPRSNQKSHAHRSHTIHQAVTRYALPQWEGYQSSPLSRECRSYQ